MTLPQPQHDGDSVVEQKSNPSEKKWSYSRLSMFESCQRQYFHKYIEKRPYPSTPPMKIGKVFHAAIDLMVREGYTPAEALYFAIGEQGGLPEGEKSYKLIWMLERAYERLPVDSEYVEIHSEMHLQLKTTLGTIEAYLDLVIDDPSMDNTEIWDYKTSWAAFSAETHIQLAIYAWIYLQIKGYVGSEYKGKLIFPRLGVEEDSEVILTEEKLLEARNWLIRLIGQVNQKDPNNMLDWCLAKDRKRCEACPYIGLCASGLDEKGLPHNGQAKDLEQAKQIGEYILLQEQALKAMKKGLKEWVEKNESVPVGNGIWRFEESQPGLKCTDIPALIEYAKQNDKSLSDALKAESNTIKEWLKSDQTGELKQLVTTTKPRKTFTYVN